jgi:flagellar M-ring protein FliF
LLAGGFESQDGTRAFTQKAEQQRLDLENHLARTIERLLERTVGPGKVRAEVFANMDFDRINTSEEIFDPDGQVVRSTQTVEEAAKSRDGSTEPPVSVATNLPDAQLAPAEGDGSESNESRTEETVNYEISKKTVNHVREAGIVNRLSVAVLVDGTYETAGDGTLSYQPRSTEELNLLAALVRGAVGFNASRGDTVEVINMRFAELETAGEEETTLIFGLTKHDLLTLAKYLVLVVFALLVLLFVVRPLLTRLIESIPAPAEPANALFGPQSAAPALAGPAGGLPALREPGSGGEELEEMIDLDRVEGRVRASTVKKVGEIVERHPEEVLSILRSWLHNNP